MSYPAGEKYVSALAVDGVGDGTEGNPWSWADARTNCGNGMRMNVKADGVYTLPVNEGQSSRHYWIKGAADNGTATQPVCWRGYTDTPGDGGIVDLKMDGTNDVLYCSAYSSTSPNRGCWMAMNFRCIWECRSGQGLININESRTQPLFINCHFENTVENSSAGYSGNVISGGSKVACVHCTFVNHQHYGSDSTDCVISNQGGWYYGCHFHTWYGLIGQTGASNSLFKNCLFTGGDSAREAFRWACINEQGIWLNCVFDGFASVNEFYRTTSGEAGNAIFANNIFRNISGPVFKESGGGIANRNYLFFANKIWNASGTYNFFDLETSGAQAYDTMWPWPPIATLPADPFKDAASGDYRLDDESLGAGPCMAAAFPWHLGFNDGLADYPPLARDIGIYQTILEEDYPLERDVRDGVIYHNGYDEGELQLPAVTDVRHGVTYDAPAVAQTGTCHVPDPADVRLDTPVDYTVGTLGLARHLHFKDQTHDPD